MVNLLDVFGVLLVAVGVIGGAVLVTGTSPAVTNPLNPVSLYTVEPNACLEQTPLRFGFTDSRVNFQEQESLAFSTIAPTDSLSLGAQNVQLKVELFGTTVNGDVYEASPMTTRFDVSDIEFLLGADKCTDGSPASTVTITGIENWKNIPAGDYIVQFTITDNGETVDQVSQSLDMPNTKGEN